MNEIDNYIKLQKNRGIIIGISGIVGFIALIAVFFLWKIDGSYIWWLILPIIIMIGIIVLGFGWYYIYNKEGKKYNLGDK